MLRLRRPLLLLELHSILMHGVTIEELLIATEAYGPSALPGRVVLRVGPRLREASGTVQCPAKTATHMNITSTYTKLDLPVFHLGLLLDAVVA